MKALATTVATALVAALLAAGCATGPKTTAPHLTSMPPLVFEAFCAKLRSEGFSSDAPMFVVKTTQPLVSGPSLRALAHLYFKDGELGEAAQAIRDTMSAMPLEFSGNTSCAWQPIERLDPIEQAQRTVVEFSSPFVNPFTRGESGVFARLSIGGRDAQWYWIPLAERDGRLGIGLVMAMDLHDS